MSDILVLSDLLIFPELILSALTVLSALELFVLSDAHSFYKQFKELRQCDMEVRKESAASLVN